MSRKSNKTLEHNLKNFVNRETVLRTLENEVFTIEEGPAKLLLLQGVGGQGKSLLLEKFYRQVKADSAYVNIFPVKVDLTTETSRKTWRPLIWVRNQLAEQGIKFPRFDLGFELFWMNDKGGDRQPELSNRWLRRALDTASTGASEFGNSGAELAVSSLTDASSVSIPLVGRVIAYLGRSWFDKMMKDRLIAANDSLAALFEEEDQKQLRPMSEILEILPTLLAQDLADLRGQNKGARFLIIFDEFESVMEQGGGIERFKTSTFEDAIQSIAFELEAAMFVVAGRERPEWTRSKRLENRLTEDRKIELNGLSTKDTGELLDREGVTDPLIRDAIISSATAPIGPDDTQPIFPLLIQLQLTRLRDLQANNQQITVSEFQISADGFEEIRKELLNRLLGQYGTELQSTLRHLAFCSRFDRETFKFLIKTFLTGLQLNSWKTIIQMSFVIPTDDGMHDTFVMHQAIRDSLVATIPPEDAKDTHRALAEFFVDRSKMESLK